MPTMRLKLWVRLLLILCGAALVYTIFIPLWRIDLNAPQYPEGLRLLIYPAKLAGNVDIINGLNHYIGMKTLHSEDFFEFTLLPYFIGFFATVFIITGILARKRMLYVLLVLFICFGILAMYDFWRWEYHYGHDLNPEAAIIVPGMAYQPPLIGFKQLLNFGAYSIPDKGGWIFLGAGMALLLSTVMTWLGSRKLAIKKNLATMLTLLMVLSLASCNTGPELIKKGTDTCQFCKMTVSDDRFGAEIVTHKGRIFKFDDIHCLATFLKTGAVSAGDIKDIYFTDFCNGHGLINEKNSSLLKSDALKSPMGGNTAAFSNLDSLKKMQQLFSGTPISWNELKTP